VCEVGGCKKKEKRDRRSNAKIKYMCANLELKLTISKRKGGEPRGRREG